MSSTTFEWIADNVTPSAPSLSEILESEEIFFLDFEGSFKLLFATLSSIGESDNVEFHFAFISDLLFSNLDNSALFFIPNFTI
ncbi:hypothetical protein Avbf_14463, partial [Armadillidium vulgare]